MKKEVLLKLLEHILKLQWHEYKNYQLLTPNNDFSFLLKLNEEQINKIISYNDPNLEIIQTYIYLNEANFDEKLQNIINENLKKHNVNLYHILPMITNKVFMNQKNHLDYIRIVLESQTFYQAEYASKTSLLQDIEIKKEYVELFRNTKTEESVKYLYKELKNKETNKSNNTYNNFKIISQCKDEKLMQLCFKILNNKQIVLEDKVTDFIKITANSYGYLQGYYISLLLQNEKVLKDSNVLDYISIISQAKEGEKARYIYELLQDEEILNNKNCIDYLKLIAQEEVNKYNAFFIKQLLLEKTILKSKDNLKLLSILGASYTKKHAFNAYRVLKNEKILQSNLIESYLKLIAFAQKEEYSTIIYEILKEEKIIDNPNSLDYLNSIYYASGKEQAKYAKKVISNDKVLSSINGIIASTCIAKAKHDYQSLYASKLLDVNKDKQLEDSLMYMIELSTSKGKEQASCAYSYLEDEIKNTKPLISYKITRILCHAKDARYLKILDEIISNKTLMNHPNIFEILKYISKSNTYEQAYLIYEIVKDEKLINTIDTSDFFFIANAKDNIKAEYISKIIKNKKTFKDLSFHYIMTISDAKEPYEAWLLYQIIKNVNILPEEKEKLIEKVKNKDFDELSDKLEKDLFKIDSHEIIHLTKFIENKKESDILNSNYIRERK